MNNSRNKMIYKIWSPVYDYFFNRGSFYKARKKIFSEIPYQAGEKILFVGVGTGADLEFFDSSKVDITAIDYSPDMLSRAKARFKDSHIDFYVMDAQSLEFTDERFDYVIASLILSVVPDAEKCFQEAARVMKKDGQMIIFDKFSPKGEKISFLKRTFRPIVAFFGTDIGLCFEKIFEKHRTLLTIKEDGPILFNGMYRKIVLEKK